MAGTIFVVYGLTSNLVDKFNSIKISLCSESPLRQTNEMLCIDEREALFTFRIFRCICVCVCASFRHSTTFSPHFPHKCCAVYALSRRMRSFAVYSPDKSRFRTTFDSFRFWFACEGVRWLLGYFVLLLSAALQVKTITLRFAEKKGFLFYDNLWNFRFIYFFIDSTVALKNVQHAAHSTHQRNRKKTHSLPFTRRTHRDFFNSSNVFLSTFQRKTFQLIFFSDLLKSKILFSFLVVDYDGSYIYCMYKSYQS